MMKAVTNVCFGLLMLTLTAAVALGQTYTNETNGSLTYTMETSSTSTCPVGSPGGTQEPVTSYSYYNFAYAKVALNGGTSYLVSPGGAYCPPSGPAGPNPSIMENSSVQVSFYPCANNSGCSVVVDGVGILYPQYKVLSIIYAAPGNLSSDGYTNTLTDGTTTSVGSSFQAGDTLTFSEGFQFFGLGSTMSWSFGTAVTTGSSSEVTDTFSEAQGVSNNSNSGASNVINHQNDLLIVWLNSAVSLIQTGTTTAATYSLGTQLQTTGDPLPGQPEAVDSLEVYAGVMQANSKGVTTVPASILNAQVVNVAGQTGSQTLPGLGLICAKHPNYPNGCTLANQCGCVPKDFAGILAADPLLAFTNTETPLNANTTANPDRFIEITGAELLAGPEEKGGNNPVNTFTESDSTEMAQSWTYSLAYSVGYSWEVSWQVDGNGPKLANATMFTWTNSDSVGESNGSAHEEAVSLSSNTVGCYEDVSIFEDTVFHTFAFQQPTGNTSCP